MKREMTARAPSLIVFSQSPWSEKARWAVEHHGIAHRLLRHEPMVGMWLTRLRARSISGRVTLPILVTDGERGRVVLRESFDIARWAEAHGHGAPLFPSGRDGEIAAWNERSDASLTAGRALLIGRLAADRAAQAEALPPGLPAPMRRLLAPIAQLGVRYFRDKYTLDLSPAGDARNQAILDEHLGALARALDGGNYLLGAFSYADIAMAVVLQMVSPVADTYLPLGPATRALWTTDTLARRHPGLVAWRDRLYARHRRP